MLRVQWIALALLAAAGCVMGPDGQTGSGRSGPAGSDFDRQVEEALARAEQVPWSPPGERTGNVTLVVERVLVDRRDMVNLDSAWRFTDEHVAVRGGDLARQNGVRVGVATGGFGVAFQAALQKSRNLQVQRTMITSLTGTTGSIAVGQDVYVPTLRYRTPRGEAVLLERAFVGASLVAMPEILPEDRVRVRLYPRFTTSDGRVIDLAEMATEVVVAHGQPMVIGGLDQSSDDAGSTLFSWGREREERTVVLTVTPYIQGAPPASTGP